MGDPTLSGRSQAPGLRIVVITGEDAVNIIQQKTAVAPIVEVRDRNDNPVAGALVTFTVQGGQNATLGGGLQSLVVTTNAAGRAAVTGFTPTASGAVQINVAAAFQGQTAAATIAQTNVMTAAQAAGAATASGAGSSSGGAGAGGGAAGGSGGGLSATTVGVVAGAAAGTIVGVREVTGDSVTAHTYTGQFSGSESLSFSGAFCRTEALTGTLKMDLTVDNEVVTGTGNINGSIITTAVSTGCAAFQNRPDSFGLQDAPVTGTTSSIAFSKAQSNNVAPNPLDPQGTVNTHDYTFTGALNGSTITGTIAHRRIIGGVVAGTATFTVTLQ